MPRAEQEPCARCGLDGRELRDNLCLYCREALALEAERATEAATQLENGTEDDTATD